MKGWDLKYSLLEEDELGNEEIEEEDEDRVDLDEEEDEDEEEEGAYPPEEGMDEPEGM